MKIRSAVPNDAEAVAAVYNQGIEDRSATFDTAPKPVQAIRERLADQVRFPLLVAEENGRVLGWAGLSSYRARECYAGIGEVSVYLDRLARGRGLGKALLAAVIDDARERGFWKLVSRAFLFNHASRAMCRANGFREVGIYEKHAALEGRWLDVVIVERLIPENLTTEPAETTAVATA